MTDTAEDLLREALNIVTGARRQSYGPPEDNFATIAGLWSTFLHRLGIDFTDPEQRIGAPVVAAMMVLTKVARLAETLNHKDSWLDIAGYAACGWRCVAPAVPTPSAWPQPRETSHAELVNMHLVAEEQVVDTDPALPGVVAPPILER